MTTAVGAVPGPGVGEPAAPHAARPYKDNCRLGHSPQDLRRCPSGTEALDAVALDSTGWPEHDVFAPAQPRDCFRHRLFGAPPGLVTGPIKVRDRHGTE